MANSRLTDNPFRDPNLLPEQQDYLDRRNAALRHYYRTGDPGPAREFGFDLKDRRESAANVWVIRSESGKYAGHFVDGCYVGAGWLRESDLLKVTARDELAAIYRLVHPGHSPQKAGTNVGMLWLFLEMQVGDYVITPCSDSQWLYYGRVVDLPYYYAPNDSDGCPFPHRRPVAWTGRRINLSEFSEGFQNTVKFTQKTAFCVKYQEEFLEFAAQKAVQDVASPKYSYEEVRDRGKKIYEERIKGQVEPDKNGKFIVIDIDSGDFEVDAKILVASRRLRERCPDSVLYRVKAGLGAAYRMGWRSVRPQ